MKKIKVSVIEDVDEIRKGFSFLISSSDQLDCISSFSNAEDALADFAVNKPDVVIMDIGLPGITGIECTVKIKERFPSVQIMICSVYDDDDRLFRALAAGANGYILKRTAPSVLISSIIDIFNGGSPMSGQIARRVVASLQISKEASEPQAPFDLSKREKEILNFLSNGYRNKEIAEMLFISTHTVKSHIYHIYEKLHVQSRVEALNKFSSGN
jgi:DNA-binding NarL/FixJ family response regulator